MLNVASRKKIPESSIFPHSFTFHSLWFSSLAKKRRFTLIAFLDFQLHKKRITKDPPPKSITGKNVRFALSMTRIELRREREDPLLVRARAFGARAFFSRLGGPSRFFFSSSMALPFPVKISWWKKRKGFLEKNLCSISSAFALFINHKTGVISPPFFARAGKSAKLGRRERSANFHQDFYIRKVSAPNLCLLERSLADFSSLFFPSFAL